MFTKGKADPNHRPSIKSCLVRVPGTINSKNDEVVTGIQNWDGKRPAIQWITTDFRIYLIQKRNDQIKENNKRRSFSKKQHQQNTQINKIEWIEKLLQTPIEDFRKQCLWRILIPYLVNIKKLKKEDASVLLNKWLQKCDGLRKIDFNPSVKIKENLKNVKKYLPPAKDKLKDQYKELYHTLKTKNIFAD